MTTALVKKAAQVAKNRNWIWPVARLVLKDLVDGKYTLPVDRELFRGFADHLGPENWQEAFRTCRERGESDTSPYMLVEEYYRQMAAGIKCAATYAAHGDPDEAAWVLRYALEAAPWAENFLISRSEEIASSVIEDAR